MFKKSKELSVYINHNPKKAIRKLSDYVIELIIDSKLTNEQIRVKSGLATSSYYYGLLENKYYNFANSIQILKALGYKLKLKIR